MNKKLHHKQEEKTGKKFVLHQEPDKKKSGSKSRKEEFNSNSLNDNDARNNLDNGNTCMFAKKKLGYLYAYLNRQNRSPIKQRGTLFNTGAETYIAKSINDFNTGIYTPATLPLIDIVGGQAKLFNFSKRTIIYTIDTKVEIYTLNLSKI